MKVIFEKMYDEESLYDLDRDISEAVSPEYNDKLEGLSRDCRFRDCKFYGSFKVIIEWYPE